MHLLPRRNRILNHFGLILWSSKVKGGYSHTSYRPPFQPRVLNDLNTGQYPYQMFLTGNKVCRYKDKIRMSLWRIAFINLVCVHVPPGLYQTLVLKSFLIFPKSTPPLLNFCCEYCLITFKFIFVIWFTCWKPTFCED